MIMNKKTIALVFTGGTICTTVKDGRISTDPTAPAALVDLFRASDSPVRDRVEFVKGHYFGILSENMTVEKWNELMDDFRRELPRFSQCDGIIIAHGTDTLAYTAALFSVLLSGISVPVFFVSSNRSILTEAGAPNPEANGAANFRAAVECICQGIAPDVYATYRNPEDGRMYLHRGSELIQCRIYDDNFYSAGALDISDLHKAALPKSANNGKSLDSLLLMTSGARHLSRCVLKVTPYVGLDYSAIDYSRYRAVLHSTYHSGTACVERTAADCPYSDSSILFMLDRCAAQGVDVYFAPSHRGDSHSVYDSVPYIAEHLSGEKAVKFHYGMTEELLYAKLLIAYSFGFSPEQTAALLAE